MGILDDAIKEHLELKRSHGASEDEIRRKEAEAFGAVRNEAPAEAPSDEHTQLLTPDETAVAAGPDLADLEPLQPAPEDPYEVHPGDEPHADPNATQHFDVEGAAEAGAGTRRRLGALDAVLACVLRAVKGLVSDRDQVPLVRRRPG